MTAPAPPSSFAGVTMPDGAKLTFMAPEEFRRICERLCGFGWQTRICPYIDRSRVQVNRYTNGGAIPLSVALLLRYYEERMDRGELLPEIRPAGYVAHGVFTAVDLPVMNGSAVGSGDTEA